MQILNKAKDLRHSYNFKYVLISPDHTLEQREVHRENVKQLKTKRTAEPDKRYYIKDG